MSRMCGERGERSEQDLEKKNFGREREKKRQKSHR